MPKENPDADGTPANPTVLYTPGVDNDTLGDMPSEDPQPVGDDFLHAIEVLLVAGVALVLF